MRNQPPINAGVNKTQPTGTVKPSFIAWRSKQINARVNPMPSLKTIPANSTGLGSGDKNACKA